MNRKELFQKAGEGNTKVLKHPDCSKIHDSDGYTPLHRMVLFLSGINSRKGLARNIWIVDEIIKHPEVSKVEGVYSETPLELLAWHGLLSEKHLKKLFPWYEHPKDLPIHMRTIEDLVATPNTCKFMME